MKKINTRGQSLFEIIFAIGIAALILVGVVSLATVSTRNATFSQNKTKATKLSQEGVEWLREQRDLDWSAFALRSNATMGLGELNWGGGSIVADTLFEREVILQTDANPNKIKATVSVSWTDGQGDHVVESVTFYTNWTTRL